LTFDNFLFHAILLEVDKFRVLLFAMATSVTFQQSTLFFTGRPALLPQPQ
jgi:hypothetical protein